MQENVAFPCFWARRTLSLTWFLLPCSTSFKDNKLCRAARSATTLSGHGCFEAGQTSPNSTRHNSEAIPPHPLHLSRTMRKTAFGRFRLIAPPASSAPSLYASQEPRTHAHTARDKPASLAAPASSAPSEGRLASHEPHTHDRLLNCLWVTCNQIFRRRRQINWHLPHANCSRPTDGLWVGLCEVHCLVNHLPRRRCELTTDRPEQGNALLWFAVAAS